MLRFAYGRSPEAIQQGFLLLLVYRLYLNLGLTESDNLFNQPPTRRATLIFRLYGALGMDNVQVRDAFAVKQALDWFVEKMDFADAWHLVLSQSCERFATFDEKLVKRVKGKAGVFQAISAHLDHD